MAFKLQVIKKSEDTSAIKAAKMYNLHQGREWVCNVGTIPFLLLWSLLAVVTSVCPSSLGVLGGLLFMGVVPKSARGLLFIERVFILHWKWDGSV